VRALVLLALCSCAPSGEAFQIGQRPPPPRTYDYAAICSGIADDIEPLRARYPQLADYRAASALERECTISYGHHTHRATHAGGWTAGVPNPDPGGIWFYISVWDPADPAEASAQINTQPVLPPWWIGQRRVTFLILEGERTQPVANALLAVLEHHEMTERR
jgi:hypothetical protein